MSAQMVDARILAWAAELAQKLAEVQPLDLGWGEYYLGVVPVMYEDESAGISIETNEHGSMSVKIDGHPA